MPDIVPSSPISAIEYANQVWQGQGGRKVWEENEIGSEMFNYYFPDFENQYQNYLDTFMSAKANALDTDNVLDYMKEYLNVKGYEPGVLNNLLNYYLTEKSNNAARDFASRANQIMVEDLKKAGLNPALLASNPQGMMSVSGSSYAGNSNITTSARDKANIKYRYDALNQRNALAITGMIISGVGSVINSAARIIARK